MADKASTPVRSNAASKTNAAPKKNRKPACLPDKLQGFLFNKTNANCLLCGGENLPSSHADAKTDDGRARVFQVTQTIKLPDGTVYDLTGKEFNLDQMRLLCKVFGAKGAGSMNKFDCRKALAMRKSLGNQYGVGKIVDPKDNDARHVTYIVLTNALFHSDFRDDFLSINNIKNRADFETGIGANNKCLWSSIADWINDPTIEDRKQWYLIDDPVYKGHVKDAVDGGISLDFSSRLVPVSGAVIGKMVKNLLKIHNKMDSNMRQSGSHNNDPFAYVDALRGFHNLKTEVSPFAAYYFYVVSKQHPAAATAFLSSLPSSLKVDSTSTIDLTDTASSVSSSLNSKKGRAEKDKFMNMLAVSATKFFDEASSGTTGPASKIKEYDDLILRYQGSILEMYKQKAHLSDEAEIADLAEMIKKSQASLRDARAQRELWVKKRDLSQIAAASTSATSSKEEISPLTDNSARKRQSDEISKRQNGAEDSSDEDSENDED